MEEEVFIHETAVIDEPCTIGSGSKIWHFSHIMPDSVLGDNCNLGQNVVVSSKVTLGNNVKVQNNVSIYDNITLEDGVFCGPSMVFTNVYNPRSLVERKDEYRDTIVMRGATLGANCTIVCGVKIGQFSFIGAGAVVTKNVPPNSIFAGNPAKLVKTLEDKEFNTRANFLENPKKLAKDFDALDRYSLGDNTFLNWIKSVFLPDDSH